MQAAHEFLHFPAQQAIFRLVQQNGRKEISLTL